MKVEKADKVNDLCSFRLLNAGTPFKRADQVYIKCGWVTEAGAVNLQTGEWVPFSDNEVVRILNAEVTYQENWSPGND